MTDSTTNTSSPSFVENVSKLWKKSHNLKTPSKYGDFNSDARGVFVSGNELQDGVNVNRSRVISGSSYHEFVVVHGISVGSMMKPPEYTMQLHYATTKGQLYSQYSTSGVLVANMRQNFLKDKLSTDLLYVNQNDTVTVKNNYTGPDYVIESEYDKDKGRVMLSYMQSLLSAEPDNKQQQDEEGGPTRKGTLKGLSAGIQGTYKTSDRKSSIATCVRWHDSKSEIAGEYTVRGSGSASNVKSLKASYCRKIDDQVSLAAELNYNLTEREASARWGFAHQFGSAGRVRISSDEKFLLKASADLQMSHRTNLNIVMDANPTTSDYKFGFNISLND